eukprot:Tamp_20321.p1 GENE.Tamp_20321~~Tamp_20321.p1  ORF type:complete len:386 (+),score=53.38 Tamp_20321:51-1160(+)
MSESQQVRDEVDSLRRILRERKTEVAARDALGKANQYQDVATLGNPAPGDQPSGDYATTRSMSTTVQSVRTIEGRVATFASGWPHTAHTNITVRDLAAAGFFFTPTFKCPDRVTCAYCGLELGSWNSDVNIAWEAHAAGNPACAFLTRLVTDIDDTSADPLRNRTGPVKTAGRGPAELPLLRDAVWLVDNYVDFPDYAPTEVKVPNNSTSNDVKIQGCQGSSKRRLVTVQVTGSPPHGEAIRSLLISNCSHLRVNVERVMIKIVVVNCNFIEIVIGGHPPHMTVKNTTGCTLTLCPEFMDHELQSFNSTGVALQVVPRDAIDARQGVVRPQTLMDAVNSNKHDTVLIPERMETKVSADTVHTRPLLPAA